MVPGDYVPTQAQNTLAVECPEEALPEVAQEERARASEKELSLIFC